MNKAGNITILYFKLDSHTQKNETELLSYTIHKNQLEVD